MHVVSNLSVLMLAAYDSSKAPHSTAEAEEETELRFG